MVLTAFSTDIGRCSSGIQSLENAEAIGGSLARLDVWAAVEGTRCGLDRDRASNGHVKTYESVCLLWYLRTGGLKPG